jgi:hypothetical protein
MSQHFYCKTSKQRSLWTAYKSQRTTAKLVAAFQYLTVNPFTQLETLICVQRVAFITRKRFITVIQAVASEINLFHLLGL